MSRTALSSRSNHPIRTLRVRAAGWLAREDVSRLVSEVASLRAALNFKQGIIDDLTATVERLEGEQ